MVGQGGNNSFAKTICSICYEDLNPIVEDLQSIFICGHVFHELCLQQWFEYCTNGKKKNCPVCKQICSESKVGRLYFQSIGDPNDPRSLSQNQRDCEENPQELRREVKRLEGKVSGLSSTLESQQIEFNEVNEELCKCKEQIMKEVALKNEAQRQQATVQQLLLLKSQELEGLTLECTRLQDKNMALAKELAALKLVSDLNMEEDEILKLASLGNEANKETVDVLKKSLVIRNKTYKELMAKCNILGRGEARSLSKLEKAKEKIKKLKTRVQELEIAVEAKDNEVLRALKVSKKSTSNVDLANLVNQSSNCMFTNKSLLEVQMKEPAPENNLDRIKNSSNDTFWPRKRKKIKPSKEISLNNCKDDKSTGAFDHEMGSYILIDEDLLGISTSMDENLCPDLKTRIDGDVAIQKSCLSRPGPDFDTESEAQVHGQSKEGFSGARSDSKGDMVATPSADMDEDVELLLGDIAQVQPLFRIRRDNPSPVSQPGDRCFSGGLVGPDGTNWHLGKWCKRVRSKGSAALSVAMQGSTTSTGDLIATGADGKGGTIKVLRSPNQASLNSKEASTLAKKFKYGAQTSGLQSRGYLQLEHFFGKICSAKPYMMVFSVLGVLKMRSAGNIEDFALKILTGCYTQIKGDIFLIAKGKETSREEFGEAGSLSRRMPSFLKVVVLDGLLYGCNV